MAAALARIVLAAVSGLALTASFAPTGWWWAGWISAALLIAALAPWGDARPAPSWRLTALVGFVWGAAGGLAGLPWIAEFVGNLPWIGLCVTLGLFHILTAAGVRLIVGAARLPWWFRALGAAAWIIAVEALLARWPFGGFPWLRYAWGQIDGPLADAASVGGVPLVGFLAAVVGAGAAAAIVGKRIVSGLVLIAVAVAAGLAVPANDPAPRDGERVVRVAAVQGNVPRLGLGFNAQRRAVLENHAQATHDLAAAVREGREEQPDIVIWPENSSDISPMTNEDAARIIDAAAADIGAPIVVGSFTYADDPARGDGTQNTMIVWDPEEGPVDGHSKRFLQPFGEWMPFRDLLRNVTDMVDMAGDMTPGDGDGVAVAGGIPVGFATCFEVIFDAAYRDAVHAGATILATPTNNATFGFTDMTYQQLAMSRMRAIEHDRAVVVAATSGVSAIVLPDGTVDQSSEIFERAVLTESLPLREDPTIAARHGLLVEGAIVALAVLAALAAAAAAVTGPRTRGTTRTGDDTDNEGVTGG
ncbi:apolipoprotein N-acyltransferase [Corynebacterium sp. 335C]